MHMDSARRVYTESATLAGAPGAPGRVRRDERSGMPRGRSTSPISPAAGAALRAHYLAAQAPDETFAELRDFFGK